MRGNAELPEQGKQAGREQQVVDVASRLLVLLDGDVLCLDELRSVVLNRAGRRFAQERQRGLGWIAVILVPTELKDEPIEMSSSCLMKRGWYLSRTWKKRLVGEKVLIFPRPCWLQKKEYNKAPLA